MAAVEHPGGNRPVAAARPRERIVDAAMRLFDQEGITGVSVGRVTREADVAQMTLYRHFDGKDELAP
jgi:AcrR family transcriptional regulator